MSRITEDVDFGTIRQEAQGIICESSRYEDYLDAAIAVAVEPGDCREMVGKMALLGWHYLSKELLAQDARSEMLNPSRN